MTRPVVEVADLLHKQGDRFMDQSPRLNFQQLSVLRAITRCGTEALGGPIDQCSQCGRHAISHPAVDPPEVLRFSSQVRGWIAQGIPGWEARLFRLPRQLANPKRFAASGKSLFQQQWVVYAKPAFGAPGLVLRYLESRLTSRFVT